MSESPGVPAPGAPGLSPAVPGGAPPPGLPGTPPPECPGPRELARRLRAWLPLVLTLAAIGIAFLWLFRKPEVAARLQQAVEELGFLAPVALTLVLASRFFTFLPANLFVPMGGFLFGPVGGLACAWIGYTAAAAGGYWLARALRGRLRRAPDASLLPGAERGGMRTAQVVLLCRLVPLLHFNLVSYTAGALRVPFWPYLAGSALGILPKLAVWVGIGAGAARFLP